MQFGVKSRKAVIFVLLIFNLFSYACGQSEAEKQKLITEYEKKAFELRMQNKNNEALKEQLKAVELNPNDAQSRIILAGIYMDLKDFTNALEQGKKSVELASNNSKLHYSLAIIFQKSGDDKNALEEFQKAVNLAPEDTNALINLGITYEDLNDKTSARKSYEKALAVDSNYVPAVYLLGELEFEDGNTDKAIELFKKAAEIKIPENRQAEQSNSQQDAKRRLQELEAKKKSSTQKKP